MRNSVIALSLCLVGGCQSSTWYAIEQQPIEEICVVQGTVLINGDQVRSATIRTVDGQPLPSNENNHVKLKPGNHTFEVMCSATTGAFSSTDLEGPTRTLSFATQAGREYEIHCEPYTHWWAIDITSKDIVAGEEPITHVTADYID